MPVMLYNARAHVSADQFGELALLIEAAIDASLVDQLNKASNIVQQAVSDMNHMQTNNNSSTLSGIGSSMF